MAAETADIRSKARKVKAHILNRYLKLADRVDEKGEGDLSDSEFKRYWELTHDFAKNVIPRTQEVTGEDGGALQVSLVKYADNIATPVSAEGVPVTPTESV